MDEGERMVSLSNDLAHLRLRIILLAISLPSKQRVENESQGERISTRPRDFAPQATGLRSR
eukprot:scaffold21530_cov37-Tisochrysis_lutea.AAC.2